MVDLDNLVQSSVCVSMRGREIISGPGYAEFVMSIFGLKKKEKKKKKIPVITMCKTIRMNIYVSCYEIFIKSV